MKIFTPDVAKKYQDLKSQSHDAAAMLNANPADPMLIAKDVAAYNAFKEMQGEWLNAPVEIGTEKMRLYPLTIKTSQSSNGLIVKLSNDGDTYTVRGMGFSMLGVALAQWITATFQDELNQLNDIQIDALIGISKAADDNAVLDGMTGESCMTKVLNALGFDCQYIYEQAEQREIVCILVEPSKNGYTE